MTSPAHQTTMEIKNVSLQSCISVQSDPKQKILDLCNQTSIVPLCQCFDLE